MMFSILILLLLIHSSSCITIRVPQDFPSISAAVSAVDRGGTINVDAGTYTGPENCNVVIDKPLIMRGSGSTIVNCDRTSMRCVIISRVIDGAVWIDGMDFINGVSPFVPALPNNTATIKATGKIMMRRNNG